MQTMRCVLQRVSRAHVEVDGVTVGSIDHGLMILLGIEAGDAQADAEWLARKIATLRIFNDDQVRFNRSVLDVEGSALVVSQFTLFGDVSRGTRPSFTAAARPEVAEPLYSSFCTLLAAQGIPVEHGVFAASMQVHLVNDGPVTLVLERSTTG